MASILAAVENGNYMKHAAAAAGVSAVTVGNWNTRGKNNLVTIRELDDEIDEKIAEWLDQWPGAMTATNPMWDAPALGGMARDMWVYILFHVLLERAQAKSITSAVGGILTAGAQSWQALAWWLERTHPEQFGRQQKIEHTGAEGGPIQTVSVESVLQRIQEIKDDTSAAGD